MNRNGKKYNQYKGIKKYKEIVSIQDELETNSSNLISSNDFRNEINFLSNEVDIKEDWISKIEFYLPYLSAAISENRRFILNEGETLDIEKVRKVSKDSVYDLARHADKIRKINEDNEVEPKKLYIIEKNDDYSLYENRFLVFLLNMLKSFVSVRFDRIKDAQSKREVITNLKNDDSMNVEGLYFNFELHDIKHREFKIEDNDPNLGKINRINAISAQVSRLCATELIKEVSKAPSIVEPIVKNNVIKNDPNFIKCYELYEFLKSYKDDGFERKSLNKSEALSDEGLKYFKYIPSLISFLSYASIKNLFPSLEEELKAEKAEQELKRVEDIEKTLNEFLNGKDINDFYVKNTIYEIFKGNTSLKDVLELERNKHQKEKNELIDNYEMKIESLNDTNSDLNERIIKEENDFKEKIETLENNHKNEIEKLNNEILRLKSEISSLRILTDESFKNKKLDVEEFNLMEKEFDAFFEYMQSNWKGVKKEVNAKKKKEIREKFKKKEKFNGK